MQMAFAASRKGISLLFADALEGEGETQGRGAEAACKRFIKLGVDGIIFCPLKLPPQSAHLNTRIAENLGGKHIPVVLLDCDICEYPERSQFDVVAVDNRRGGYVLASHLWNLGCRRIEFVAAYWNRPTVAARIAGYRDFMIQQGVMVDPGWIHRGDLSQPSFIAEVVGESQAEAFMCTNDWTAAVLMRALISSGTRIPHDVRVVGFDDINIADILPVSLTTYGQPVEELGAVAIEAMLERLANPDRPARHIMLDGKLIVRESCGAQL